VAFAGVGGRALGRRAELGAELRHPPGQIADAGAMAGLLRDVDLAVFPNRCEGGTNLVAMECLAAGVPTVLGLSSLSCKN
jgi:hypothetical protein